MPFNVKFALMELAKYNGQSGTCWDDPTNLARLNRVRMSIYSRGDFHGTTEWVCTPKMSGCFFLPIKYEGIRMAWRAKRPIQIVGRFSSVTKAFAQNCSPCSVESVTATGIESSFHCSFPPSILTVRSAGKFTLRIEDPHGDSEAYEFDPGAHELYGLISSNHKISKQSDDDIYIFKGPDPVAYYPSWSDTPKHVQYEYSGNGSLIMLLKKAFYPLSDLLEPVDIESIDSLVYAYQAINAQEAGDDVMYASKVKLYYEALSKTDANLEIETSNSGVDITYPCFALPSR